MSRTATRSAKPIYRYRVTRLGFHFLFVGLFAIIGGSLRGFNLLLLLAGVLMGAMLVQWRQGRRAIRRTRLSRRSVGGCFAGSTLNVVYDVANAGQWLPIWMIRIEDRCDAADRPVEVEAEGDAWGGEQYPVMLYGAIGGVAPGGSATTSVICRFERRGVFLLGPVIASTGFPFSLISSERLEGQRRDRVHVYPRLVSLGRGWRRMLPPRRGGEGNRSTGGTQHDGEFFGLRPWQSGDQVKHIHWRTTARIGEPAVRQFEQRDRHQVCVVVDASCTANTEVSERRFELELSVAATLLGELASTTRSVRLLVIDGISAASLPEVASPPSGDGNALQKIGAPERSGSGERVIESIGSDLSELLCRLAVSRPLETGRNSGAVFSNCLAAVAQQLRHDDLVVISWRSLSEAAAVGENRSRPLGDQAFWRHYQQRGRLAWWDLSSARTLQQLGLGNEHVNVARTDERRVPFRNPASDGARSERLHQ